jgi:hypothetical protein
MNLLGISFDFARVSTIQVVLTLGIAAAIIIIYGLYLLIFVGYFGKPMMKYLTARFNQGTGIIQEYTNENLTLKMAKVKAGEFTSIEEETTTTITPIKRPVYQYIIMFVLTTGSAVGAILSYIYSSKYTTVALLILLILSIILSWKINKILPSVKKTIHTEARPIVAQSTIGINGIETIMVWNITPPLPERYLDMLRVLTSRGYNNTDEILTDIYSEAPKITLDQLILDTGDKTTIRDFLSIHAKIRDRNKVIVTPEDILSFSDKYMDEHSKKSVIEKEVTIAQKRLGDDKYQKYAFYIIAFMVIMGFALKIYKMKTGGGTP